MGSLYPVSYNLFGALTVLARQPDGGIDPFPFHFASLLIHIASALLVWAILRLLIKRDWAACAGAVLFAVHPVQVEAVAWVSGMNTLLFALLSLWAIWQYLLAARPGVSPNQRALPSRTKNRLRTASPTMMRISRSACPTFMLMFALRCE